MTAVRTASGARTVKPKKDIVTAAKFCIAKTTVPTTNKPMIKGGPSA